MIQASPTVELIDGAAALDRRVTARLRAIGRRIRLYVLLEGLAWMVGFLLVAGLVQFILDYGTRGLQWSMRAAMLAAIVVGAGAILWRRVIRPLRHRVGPAEVANLVERRYPQLGSLLISAVRFSRGEVGPVASNSPALVRSVLSRAAAEVSDVDFGVVVESRRARYAGVAIAASMGLAVALMLAAPATAGLWFARNVLLQDVEWPKRTHLLVDIEGDELIGARGDDVVVQAHAQGVQPRIVEIVFETLSGQRGREPMVTVGSEGDYRYRYTFKNAQEDFTFYLVGGDDQTRRYRARLLERPQVSRTEMRIEPPEYSGLPVASLPDGQRTAEVLLGSRVTIWIETNKPVVQAALMMGTEKVADAVQDGDRWMADVIPDRTRTYHFYLLDQVDLENRNPLRFSLRVVQDEPPGVRMQLPGVGEMITPEAILPIQVEFTDTYGLATAVVVYRAAGESLREGSIELTEFEPGRKSFATTVRWPVVSENMQPGQTLTLRAEASDFDDVSGPNYAQTPEVTLRVVTREELLAEMARREREYRLDFERLVDAQEDVRRGLLTALQAFEADGDAEKIVGDLAALERRQRSIGGSVNVVRQQFEQILAELEVNRLDTADERLRLTGQIIDPLTALAKRDLVAAADAIRAWSRDLTETRASAIDPQQVAILSQMRAVLESMIEWEGYQEVISMLRDIMRLQQELREETRETLEKQAAEIFEDGNQ